MVSSEGDYYKTFILTAMFHALGIPILIYISTIVPKKEKFDDNTEENKGISL